jgi:HSP20 family protein
MSLIPWKASTSMPVTRSRLNDELFDFQREMNNLMRNFFSTSDMGSPVAFDASFYPSIDLKEKEDKYLLDADIPGMNESDINLDFHNNVLTIKGEKKSETETKDAGFVCVERSRGTFRRDISFNDDIDQEKIMAKYKNGVLHVELAKKEKTKESHRKIDIKQ